LPHLDQDRAVWLQVDGTAREFEVAGIDLVVEPDMSDSVGIKVSVRENEDHTSTDVTAESLTCWAPEVVSAAGAFRKGFGEPVEREAVRESLCLELKDAIPVFVFTPFGTSSLLPQHVGALAEMLVKSAMPVFVCIAGWASVFFPKKVGPFANFLL
jgi:hypothetical protein